MIYQHIWNDYVLEYWIVLLCQNNEQNLENLWQILELDEMSTGPIPVGTHEFLLEAGGPNPALIPTQEIVGVTVVLITCSYRDQEFVRIGKLSYFTLIIDSAE